MSRNNFGSSRQFQRHSELQLWQEYSRRKDEWARRNPRHSEQEYDQAIGLIAKELGI